MMMDKGVCAIQQKEILPYAVILQKTHLRLLWQRAKTAGFTKQSIWRLLIFVQINPLHR